MENKETVIAPKKQKESALTFLEQTLKVYEECIHVISESCLTTRQAKQLLRYNKIHHGICHYIFIMLHRNKIKVKDVRIIEELLYNIDVNLRYNHYCTIPEKCRTIRGVLSSLEKRKGLINKLISSLKNQ